MRHLGTIAVLALLPALTASAGCYRQTLVVSGTTPQLEPAARQWRHHLLNGIIGLSGDLDLREACPQGVSRVESSMTVLNGLFWLVTGTIYAPTTTWVYCQLADPPALAPPAPAPPSGEVPVIDQGSLAPEPGG